MFHISQKPIRERPRWRRVDQTPSLNHNGTFGQAKTHLNLVEQTNTPQFGRAIDQRLSRSGGLPEGRGDVDGSGVCSSNSSNSSGNCPYECLGCFGSHSRGQGGDGPAAACVWRLLDRFVLQTAVDAALRWPPPCDTVPVCAPVMSAHGGGAGSEWPSSDCGTRRTLTGDGRRGGHGSAAVGGPRPVAAVEGVCGGEKALAERRPP